MKTPARKRRHEEPSKESLEEIPEIDFKKVKSQPNPYAARIAVEGYTINVAPGRPKKGEETGPTVPRSIRFPAPMWKKLEKLAKAEGMTLHAVLRTAVLEWVGEHTAKG